MVTARGRGDPERMDDRDTSGAYQWNLSAELEAERRRLQAGQMHVVRLNALLDRLNLESNACEGNQTNRLADIDTPATRLLRARRLAHQPEAYASDCDRLTEEAETLLVRGGDPALSQPENRGRRLVVTSLAVAGGQPRFLPMARFRRSRPTPVCASSRD